MVINMQNSSESIINILSRYSAIEILAALYDRSKQVETDNEASRALYTDFQRTILNAMVSMMLSGMRHIGPTLLEDLQDMAKANETISTALEIALNTVQDL